MKIALHPRISRLHRPAPGPKVQQSLRREIVADPSIIDLFRELTLAVLYKPLPSEEPLRDGLRPLRHLMVHPEGSPLSLSDMKTAWDPLISGAGPRVYDHLPATAKEFTNCAGAGHTFSRWSAKFMRRLATFVKPNIVNALLPGRDPQTSCIQFANAIGPSVVTPAMLQYAPPVRAGSGPRPSRKKHQMAMFDEGGVSANVPARIPWEGVHTGRIGRRNAFYLALDCFQPQYEPRHLSAPPLGWQSSRYAASPPTTSASCALIPHRRLSIFCR